MRPPTSGAPWSPTCQAPARGSCKASPMGRWRGGRRGLRSSRNPTLTHAANATTKFTHAAVRQEKDIYGLAGIYKKFKGGGSGIL